MYIPDNEGKVCDAVVRFLEKRTGAIRTQVRHPELDGAGPPVELRLKLDTQEYAIEHTKIESFENQIKTGVIIDKILDHFKKNLPVPFPSPAYYELQYPIDICFPTRKAKRERALNNLVEWICTNEKVLRERIRGRLLRPNIPWFADDFVCGMPAGLDCKFELLCWLDAARIGREPGSLLMRPIFPEDLNPQLTKRLMRGFSDKCPKLHRCKAEGARTVLVLESNDIALTHFEFRTNLLPKLLAKHTNAPDEIFLVLTHSNLWWVWPIKCNDDHWPTVGMPELNQPIYEEDKLPTAGMPKWYRDALGLDELYKPHPKGWVPETFEKDELNNLTLNCD